MAGGVSLRVGVGRAAAEVGGSVGGQGAPLRLPHTDWLFHHLAIGGPAEVVGVFRKAAAGSGTVPWKIDFDQGEEDWFHRLAAARDLSLAGARILARQLREAAERRHAVALARVGQSRACPLDLQALVPVPAAILALGPDHPDALAWLWQRWGTTEPLRHVALDKVPTRAPAPKLASGEGRLFFNFWSADWTPWRAIGRIRANWPALRLDLQPQYDAG